MRAGLWLLGVTGSCVAHAALALALPVLVAPAPVPPQPRPETRISLGQENVAQSAAAEDRATGEAVAPDEAPAATLGEGVVPQSQAEALEPRAEALAAVAPPAPMAAKPPPAPEVAEVPPPEALPQAALPPPAPLAEVAPPQVLVAEAPPPAPAEAALPGPVTLAATAPPGLAVAASAAPSLSLQAAAPAAAALSPDLSAAMAPQAAALPAATQTVAPQAPSGTALPPEVPQLETQTAALAWSGGGEASLDPQSLATIESFLQAGDPQAPGAAARDALGALLASVPCARLQAEFDPATGALALRGHIPEDGMRGAVLATLQAQIGAAIPVADEMLILPRPQCGALAGIDAVGLPQSTDQATDPRLLGPGTQARVFSYTGGQTLTMTLEAPDYDAYIYVDFFDAGGQVIHLIPNETIPLTLHPAKSAVRVGAASRDEPGLMLTIGPPYGQEIVAAFAASRPLGEGLRPLSEPAGPYLDWLAEAVAQAREEDPGFKGEWVYFFISTSAG